MKSKTEFSTAVHVLLALLHEGAGRLNSDDLARSVGSHPVRIRRLVSKLGKAGLVESKTGRDGGVRLVKNPKKISVYDIMIAVGDADVIKLHRSPANRTCAVSCQIDGIMDAVRGAAESAVYGAFKKLTLADLFAQVK